MIDHYRAMIVVNDLPSGPTTMGGESSGLVAPLVFALNLAPGAAGGAILGLISGVGVGVFSKERG